MTKLLQYCAEHWAEFWQRPAPAEQPRPDTSYDEVSQQQIRRMNEYAANSLAKGNWVTDTLET